MNLPLRFLPEAEAAEVPNVVVDGAPNPNTVLSLTHWPGFPAPDGLAADLSAQMVFRYLDEGAGRHHPARVVTNNHFDQDGLVSVFALVDPETALAQRAFLEDVAAAGDFATYRDRRAARLSMAVAAYADPARSPLGAAALSRPYPQRNSVLYTELLDRLPALAGDLDGAKDLWADEDAELSAAEAALASGSVTLVAHLETAPGAFDPYRPGVRGS